MNHIKPYRLFESVEKESIGLIDKFKRDYGTDLDMKLKPYQIEIINKAFSHFNKKFIKNKIQKIKLKDLGGVHGKWTDTEKKHQMTLNPTIFDFIRKFDNYIPYSVFIIVHEIGHCIDHIEKISFSKKWQAISGWKKCDINDVIPEGYDRYIEKRKGREEAGPKKSDWVYKEGSNFCRKYSSRNPREDFADSFAFAVFKDYDKFEGEGGKEKLQIIKELLSKI